MSFSIVPKPKLRLCKINLRCIRPPRIELPLPIRAAWSASSRCIRPYIIHRLALETLKSTCCFILLVIPNKIVNFTPNFFMLSLCDIRCLHWHRRRFQCLLVTAALWDSFLHVYQLAEISIVLRTLYFVHSLQVRQRKLAVFLILRIKFVHTQQRVAFLVNVLGVRITSSISQVLFAHWVDGFVFLGQDPKSGFMNLRK